jgi:hypothetical protein
VRLLSALADYRLFVVDIIGAWDETLQFLFSAREAADALRSVFDIVDDRSPDRTHLTVVDTDAMVSTLGSKAARTVRYRQEGRINPDDMLVHAHNPSVSGDAIGGFYANAAEQALRTRPSEDGIQYVTPENSPSGSVGTTPIEYVEKPPYLRVQDPPQTRESPYPE